MVAIHLALQDSLIVNIAEWAKLTIADVYIVLVFLDFYFRELGVFILNNIWWQ